MKVWTIWQLDSVDDGPWLCSDKLDQFHGAKLEPEAPPDVYLSIRELHTGHREVAVDQVLTALKMFQPYQKILICKFYSLYLSIFGWVTRKITYLQVSFLQIFLRLVWLLFDGLEWNVFFQICLVTACQASQVSRIVPAAFEPMVWSPYNNH